VGATTLVYRRPAVTPDDTNPHRGRSMVAASRSRRRSVEYSLRSADNRATASPATNPETAAALHLTVAPVKTHLRALFHQFGVEDLPQNEKRRRLVRLALQSGLVTERDLR